jgi:poly-gamma-glutamate synthesis protein (capsule biosynthesis protein)
LQHGVDAFQETIDLLEKHGVGVIGLAGDEMFASRPLIRQVKGVSIAFLGYSQMQENFQKVRPLLYARGELQDMLGDIRRLRASVDFVVVSSHWGTEQMDRPCTAMVRLARQLIESGADIILGHHPHVLQAIERYQTGVICYSLGNLVFDTVWDRASRQSAVVRFMLRVRGRMREIDYKIIPVRVNDAYQPTPMSGYDRKRALLHIQRLSEPGYYARGDLDEEHDRRVYQREAQRRERWLALAKLAFVAQHPYRLSTQTWSVLIGQKLLGRLWHRDAPKGPAELAR